MTDTPYDTIIAELVIERDRITEQLNKQTQLRALYICPFTVGQTIINGRGVVTNIRPCYGESYRLAVRYLKKNGEPGLKPREVYDWEGWVVDAAEVSNEN